MIIYNYMLAMNYDTHELMCFLKPHSGVSRIFKCGRSVKRSAIL